MISTPRLAKLAMLLLLANFAIDVRAEIIIHETFDDGDFADGSPGLWERWGEGNGTLELVDGGLVVDATGQLNSGVQPTEVGGQPLERSTDWSIRARLTPISADFGWAGVGTTQLSHASFRNDRFVAGNQLNVDTWDDIVSPLDDEEFIIQIDAFDNTLTGYAWRFDSPDEIMTASIDFRLRPSFPVLYTSGRPAKFHEAWISTTPIPLPGAELSLQAGDADQDLDFDQFDLVQVQIAAKYLTGQPATWGEGDWDGSPGGEPGNPPAGNGLFDQLDVITALAAGTYLTGPYAAVEPNGQLSDGQTSVIYNAGTGEMAVDPPAGVELTSINIDSTAGIFTGEAAANLGGSFDNDAAGNIFKATFGGSFGSLSFGNVAQAGLSEEFVLGDLSVIGSLAGGGDLGNVDLVYVPEPASILSLSVGLVIALIRIRRTRVNRFRRHRPRLR